MTEPLFFDCLTDAQFWSLFDSGVLHAYMLPGEVYARLERIAPAHGCYLFTWPADVALPLLQDIVPSIALPGQELPHQAHSDGLQAHMSVERMRSEIEAFCARAARLADKYGPGFVLTAEVKEAIRKHQPVYRLLPNVGSVLRRNRALSLTA